MACSIADWPRGGELWSEPSSAQEERFWWDINGFLQKCHRERQRLGTGDKRWRSVDFSFGGATWTLFLSLDQEDYGCRFGIHVLAHTASKAPHSDCRGEIDFGDCLGSALKTLECRLRCVSAGSHFEVEDFLSDTELDHFLRIGVFIVCRLRISPSSAEEAPSRPDIGDVSRSAAGEADWPDPTRTRLPGSDPTAFLEDAAWPRGGDRLQRKHPSPWVTAVSWKILSFLTECRAARESSGSSCKKLKSRDFSFGDGTFTLFMSLDAREERSRIGIHFRTSVSSDEEFVCRSEIHTKSFWSQFRCESAEYHWTVSDFLSHSELDEFLSEGGYIDCTISRQTRSNREACSQTEVPSSSMSSTLDAHSQTEHLEISNEMAVPLLPQLDLESVSQDWRELLRTSAHSDVQLKCKDGVLQAHKLVLVARSTVFSTMFKVDMKESRSGVVDMPDVDAETLNLFLEFVYCGRIQTLPSERVPALYSLGDKYAIDSLRKMCASSMISNLSKKNYVQYIHLATSHKDEHLIKALGDKLFASS